MFYSLKTLLSEFFHIVLYCLACIIPKQKNRWSAGAWYGKTYNDNPKYIFEYVSAHEKHIDIAWITKERKVRNYVRSKGYKSYLTYELRGILHMLTSGVALFCQTKQHDLSGSCIGPQTKLIQLWHGFSFKKYLGTNPIRMPLEREVSPLVEKMLLFFALLLLRKKYVSLNDLPYRNEYWDSYHLICAKSPRHKQKFLDIIPSLNPSKIIVAEYPRSDAFFNSNYTSPFIEKIKTLKSTGATVGIFMPTFRSQGATVPEVFLPRVEEFATYCKLHNIHMFMRLHRNDASLFKESPFHIISDDDIDWDIYPVLSHTDFLLTDYSSIYSDYPLLNKPILFTPFDKEAYIKFRGLYGEYDEITAGRSARNWDEVVRLLSNLDLNPATQPSLVPKGYTKKLYDIIATSL